MLLKKVNCQQDLGVMHTRVNETKILAKKEEQAQYLLSPDDRSSPHS
jgi:hypothetical protein